PSGQYTVTSSIIVPASVTVGQTTYPCVGLTIFGGGTLNFQSLNGAGQVLNLFDVQAGCVKTTIRGLHFVGSNVTDWTLAGGVCIRGRTNVTDLTVDNCIADYAPLLSNDDSGTSARWRVTNCYLHNCV